MIMRAQSIVDMQYYSLVFMIKASSQLLFSYSMIDDEVDHQSCSIDYVIQINDDTE